MIIGATQETMLHLASRSLERGSSILHLTFTVHNKERVAQCKRTLAKFFAEHGAEYMEELILSDTAASFVFDSKSGNEAEHVANLIRENFKWMCDVMLVTAPSSMIHTIERNNVK